MPNPSARQLARICRTQAAWAMDPATKALLLDLAREYETVEPGNGDDGEVPRRSTAARRG